MITTTHVLTSHHPGSLLPASCSTSSSSEDNPLPALGTVSTWWFWSWRCHVSSISLLALPKLKIMTVPLPTKYGALVEFMHPTRKKPRHPTCLVSKPSMIWTTGCGATSAPPKATSEVDTVQCASTINAIKRNQFNAVSNSIWQMKTSRHFPSCGRERTKVRHCTT